MIKLESKIISLRTSFTAEEIAAKLLGWLRGPGFSKYIEITSYHLTEDQLIRMPVLDESLEIHLTRLLNAAMDDYAACGDDVPYEIAIAKEEEIERIEELARRALRYLADINQEIMMGDGSMLEKCPDTIGKNGETYYTIKSADKWAIARYGISIINYVEPVVKPKEDAIVVERDGEGSEKGLSKTVTNNFYVTFALLIEAFVDAVPDYKERLKKLDWKVYHWQTAAEEEEIKARIVVSNLAEYLSLRSRISGYKDAGGGQSNETITTHIENAMAYKAKVWEKRKEKLKLPTPKQK